MKTVRKNLTLICLVLLAVCCIFGVSAGSYITADAGCELKQPTTDNFDSGRISDYWTTSNAEIKRDEGVAPALLFSNAAEGAGLITLDEVDATSVSLEIDFDGLNFANGGWLGFMFGTKSTEHILDWTEFGKGDKYITLSYHSVYGWMLRTYYNVDGSPKRYNFVDATGNDICLATKITGAGGEPDAGDYSYYLIGLPQNSGVLSNITVITSLDASGNFTFAYRNAGETASENKILAKSKDVPFEGYKKGHLGFCVMQGNSGISGKVGDFRTYKNGSTTANTAFRFSQDNIGSDYLMDSGKSTESTAFVKEGKMRLNSTNQTQAYAIHKIYASFDTDILSDSGFKNIVVSETVYFDSFDDGDEFYFHFGLEKASNVALGNKGTYAVKVTSESGAKYFQVIRYASDSGDYTEVTSKTAFGYSGGCAFALEIYGDGSGKVVLGNATQTLTGLTFNKSRLYFANRLNGTASILIDTYRMENAIYSKPDNKNLSADFTDDDINIKEWYLPTWGGNLDERYDGVYAKNGQLVFKNVNSNAGITTMAQFSNFELSFDITDVQREGVDDGDTSTDIRIMYGIQGYQDSFAILYIQEERPMFSLRPSDDGKDTNYSILHTENEKAGTLPEKYNIFSAESEGKIFNISLKMTDGKLVAAIKLSTETDWYEIFSIQESSGSITGHIRISGYGDGVLGDGACSNFCIDNLSVKNTDKEPNDNMDYGYESSKAWITWDGYDYEDTWKDDELLPIYQQEENSGCASSVNGGAISIGLLLLACATVVFVKCRKGGERK